MLEGQIAVDAHLQPCHHQHAQIGLQGMSTAGRGHHPEGCPRTSGLANGLGSPQQEGELLQGDRLRPESPVASPALDSGGEVHTGDRLPSVHGYEINALAILPERLLDRRWWHAPALIRPREVDGQAHAVLQEIAI